MATVQAVRGGHAAFRIPLNELGGGKVVQPFRMAGKYIPSGTQFSAEEIRSMNPACRTALIGKHIAVWPKASDAGKASTSVVEAERAERHIVSLGFRRFAVIEGVRLTPTFVTEEEAYAIAGKPMPKRRNREH